MNNNCRAQVAKLALERVCSGAGLDPPSCYYSPSFVDHVNDQEFRGLAGVDQSVRLYRKLLKDIMIRVEDQVHAGDRVTSRFVVTGTSFGRRVCFRGITISRFENGLIVEDWSVTDALGMLRQLGLARSLLTAIKTFGMVPAAIQQSRETTAGLSTGRRARERVRED